MTIVGGSYSEICFEPIWENIFGSGFRAVSLILENNNAENITYYTCADPEVKAHLEYYARLFPNLSIKALDVFKSPEFRYDYPLRTPVIFPRPDLYCNHQIMLEAHGENILAYGLLEASIKVKGNKVVYDPQSPSNPQTFKSTGSTADRLVIIVNKSEAKKISGSESITEIKKYFFTEEKCYALIIKMGAQGALLFESVSGPPVKIPVYVTNTVWPIGSGDVFSAYFAWSWFNGRDLRASAIQTSKATALYCNSKDLSIIEDFESFPFQELIIEDNPSKQVYLAGPFFTFSDRWIVNEAWGILRGFGLRVFSPFHDVGHGKAKDVVDQDLKGLDSSDVVFAIIDGLDSGTLFEVGYAVSQRKKVIAFVQNEDEESLKMLEGTGCMIEQDFTTAIYKTYWAIASA